MSHIDDRIARIPAMAQRERDDLAARAKRMLATPSQRADAERVLTALAAAAPPAARERIVTGLLAWDPHEAGRESFHGYDGKTQVARIFKRANHTGGDKDVYSVTVLGEDLPGSFERIAEAREAGEESYRGRVKP